MKIIISVTLLFAMLLSTGCKNSQKEKEIARLNEIILELQSQNAALDLEIQGYQSELAGLTSDLAGQVDHLQSLTSQLSDALAQLSALEEQNELNEDQIANQQALIASIQEQISTAQGDLSSLQSQVQNLESSLSDAYRQRSYYVGAAWVAGFNAERLTYGIPQFFEFLKVSDVRDNWIIIRNHSTGELIAVDMTEFDPADYDFTGNSFSYHWEGEANGGTPNYVGGLTDNGDGTYSAGGELFETTTEAIKDLERLAAIKEKRVLGLMTRNLVSHYGLSEERADHIAKVSMNFQKQSFQRSMTSEDLEIFTEEAFGISYDEVRKAAISSDSEDLQNIFEKAANANGISPEHAREIISELLLK